MAAACMRPLLLVSFALLTACAHRPAATVASPSAVGVIRAISSAQSAAARLAPHVTPEGKQSLDAMDEALTAAQSQVASYEETVNEQFKALQAAQDEALYWQQKQQKALKELWMWRGLALLIGAGTLAAIGIRTGWKFAL